jgi:hypothetical protein
MDKLSNNPLVVGLFFVLRCLVPLMIMLGISYLLKKFGWIAESPPPPPDWDNGDKGEEEQKDQVNHDEGGPAHGIV